MTIHRTGGSRRRRWPPARTIPRVLSRAAQAAAVLRDEIRGGAYREILPGELVLADRLQVSRPTLRSALNILRREGLLRTTKGQRTRVLLRPTRSGGRGAPRVIGVLSAAPHHAQNSFSLFLFGKLQEAAHNAGFELELRSDPRLEFSCPSRSLDRLVTETQAACWVHFSSLASVQEWFRTRGIPSLLLGTAAGDLRLPYIGVDHKAVARHAVEMLLGRGLGRIAVIVPRDVLSESLPGMDRWREAFVQAGRVLRAHLRVCELDFLEWGVKRTLDRALEASPSPVALIVLRPKHVLAIMSYLMHHGMRLPADVSLISIGYEPFLDFLTPTVAHYELNWDAFARRLCRLTLRLAPVMGG
jgi:DNA-binding LacI/PurR family transcriptional regulator